MLRPSLALLGFGLLVISACSPDHYVADKGRESILGMDADTLKSCAGIPTRTEHLNSRTALYSYENKYERTGGAHGYFAHYWRRVQSWWQRLLLSRHRPNRGRQGGSSELYRRQRRHDRQGRHLRPDLSRLPEGAGEGPPRARRQQSELLTLPWRHVRQSQNPTCWRVLMAGEFPEFVAITRASK